MYAIAAEPVVAFADAFRAPLVSDPLLLTGGTSWRALTGVFGHLADTARVSYPYLVLGQRTVDGDAGAMQVAGHLITLQIDGWSDAKGPFEIEAIGSRVFALMERRPGFRVSGFAIVHGSLHREFGDYFPEPDPDKPGSLLYRLVQRWTVELHES